MASKRSNSQVIATAVRPVGGRHSSRSNAPRRAQSQMATDGVANSPAATGTLDTVHVVPPVIAGSTATFTGGRSVVTLESSRGVPFQR